MEAPNCYDCKLIPWGHKCPHEYETLVRDSATVVVPHRNAGPDCPFVLLAAKDAEIEGLRSGFRRIIEINEAYQIEEYGRPVRDTIEMTIARAALGGEA